MRFIFCRSRRCVVMVHAMHPIKFANNGTKLGRDKRGSLAHKNPPPYRCFARCYKLLSLDLRVGNHSLGKTIKRVNHLWRLCFEGFPVSHKGLKVHGTKHVFVVCLQKPRSLCVRRHRNTHSHAQKKANFPNPSENAVKLVSRGQITIGE